MTKRFVGNTIYALSMLFIILMRIFVSLGMLSGLNSFEADSVWTPVIQAGIMGILPLSLYLIYLKLNGEDKPFKRLLSNFNYTNKISYKSWLIIIIIAVMTIFVTSCISSVWSTILSEIGYKSTISKEVEYTAGTLILDLFLTGCFPAVFEEFMNRGLLYESNLDDRDPLKVIFLTAIMFALMHTNVRQVLYTFIFGLIAGMLVYTTKSIWPAMCLHFLNNVESVLLNYAFTNDKMQGVQKLYNYLSYNLGGEIISIILFIVFSISIFVLLLKLLSIESERRISIDKCNFVTQEKGRFDNVPLIFVAVLNSSVTIITLIWGIIR